MMKKLLFISLLFIFSESYSQHTYQFAGALTGSGPALTQVFDVVNCAPDNGTPGSFGSETIITSAGTSPDAKQVFFFNQNSGLSYSNSTGLGITGTYTIHIFYRLNNFTSGAFSFQKLIDFSNGTCDIGLHTRDNGAGGGTLSSVTGTCGAPAPTDIGTALNTGQYYLISLVRDGVTNLLDIYRDGSIVLSGYNDAAGDYASNGTNPIILFRDDVTATFPCESGPGAVRHFSVSSSASSALQVQATWLSLSGNVLPVNLTDLNAQKNNTDVLLQWQTLNEINTAFYDVERSTDGQNFTAVSRVNAKNASTNSYSYNDVAALSLSTGYTYYRLKMTDISGRFTYSSKVKIANGKEVSVSVFPNPATNIITISGLNNRDLIRLLSVDGKTLLQKTIGGGAQSMILNIEKYKPGTYILQVQNETEITQQKIIKY